MPMSNDRRVARLAVLAALGAVLQVAESLLPHPVPGVRLGLANIVTLLALVELGPGSAVGVALLRSMVSSLVLGTFLGPGFALSLAGGLASALVMALLFSATRRSGFRLFGLVGVSVAGAAAHVLAQLALVYLLFVTSRGVWLLWPWLALSAVLTGTLTGLVAAQALGREGNRGTEARSRTEKSGAGTGLGRYEPGSSVLHRAPAALKVGIAALLALAVAGGARLAVQAGAALVLLGLTAASGARLAGLARGLARLAWFVLLALLMPVLFTPWGEILVRAGPLVITRDGLAAGALFAGRIILLYWVTALLATTTEPAALTAGLATLLRPLRGLGVREDRVAQALGIAWAAFPVLWQDARRLVRGIGRPAGRLDALVRIPGDLVANLYVVADELTDAGHGEQGRG
jgi:heptaprenyl diphosphate synthase